MNTLQTTLLAWSIAAIIVIPLLIILLNEVIDRLHRAENSLARHVEQIRDIILPLMALLIVLRLVFQVEERDGLTLVISTIFWSLLITSIFRISRYIINPPDGERQKWVTKVPAMFLRLPPYIAITVIAVHIVQNVWALPLSEMATTLGLGSVIVAFALQDTISNIVSGLLILVNSPFKQGEWIHVGDVEGCVVGVYWRYTTIETRDGDLITFPNGAISQESIQNHSRPTRFTRITQSIDVAFSNPPNRVKEMFMNTMRETPGILHDPAPDVAVTRIDDPLMGYEVRYWIDDFAHKESIHNRFMTRIWYATKRYDVALPSPAFDLYTYDGPTVNRESEITAEDRTAMLSKLQTFSMLPSTAMAELGEASEFMHYAHSEYVLKIGDNEEKFYVLSNGSVRLSLCDREGTEHLIKILEAGEFFGEAGLFGKSVSTMNAYVESDSEILCIPYETINNMINRYTEFSAEINTLIIERNMAVQRVVGEEEELKRQYQFSTNGTGEEQ